MKCGNAKINNLEFPTGNFDSTHLSCSSNFLPYPKLACQGPPCCVSKTAQAQLAALALATHPLKGWGTSTKSEDLPISGLLENDYQSGLSALEDFIKKYNSHKNQNPYDLAIEFYKSIVHPLGTPLESHHILPKFAGGTNLITNLIKVKILDHNFLHWLRWQVYQESGDQKAYLFRRYNTEERAIARKILAREANIASGKGWYCSATQRELGLRGGAKGGSANTEAQFIARQKVGLAHGHLVGKTNQSPKMKAFLKKPSCWSHLSGVLIAISPQETFHDIINILRENADQKIINEATMYKLLDKKQNSKARFYGWKIVDMPIRSETVMVNDSVRECFFITEESIPE